MANMRRFGATDLLLLALVVVVAGGLRAGYLVRCANGSHSDGPLLVQDPSPLVTDQNVPEDMRGAPRPTELDVLIHNVRESRWFGSQAPLASGEEQTAHLSPGYPWLVGLLAGVLREDDRLDSTVRWLQAALGALTAGLYYLFARRAFRSLAVGTLAGLFAACHPFWIIDTAQLADGTLASFALGGVLFLASQAGEKGGALRSLLFGLVLAGLALVRAPLLVFSFAAFIWFLLRSRSLPSGWLCALLAFLGFLIGLAPWMVRNYRLFNEPVPIASSAYLHLWIGNNPEATGGPATPKMMESPTITELRTAAREERLSQPARYARLGKAVTAEVRDRPARTLERRLRATLAFFLGYRWLTDGEFAEPADETGEISPDWLARSYPAALQGTMLVMLMLGFLGWRWSYGWRWESVPATLAMIWVPLPYLLSHAEALSGPRLPLDGVLLCYAAFALAALVPRLSEHLLDPADAGKPRPVQA
jgi:4-amino-4-deoxy-L-arabinose transferase-like glycosyltransferase